MPEQTAKDDGQRGGVLPLLALALAMVLLSAVLIGGVLGRAATRAEAQAAADAAALAGAVEGRAGAVELASLNGAELVVFTQSGPTVFVVVMRDGVRASAHAEQQVLKAQPGCPSLGCGGQ